MRGREGHIYEKWGIWRGRVKAARVQKEKTKGEQYDTEWLGRWG